MLIIPPIKRKPRVRPLPAATPEPPPPPGPPHVVSTNFSGNTVTMTFDQPVECGTGEPTDDAITVNGMTPTYAINADAHTISMAFAAFVNAGEPWAIAYQPAWVTTAIAVPEAGTL